MQKFEAHFKPATNLTFNEFPFGSRSQDEGESFTYWLTELKTLTKSCEFGELEERLLRSRIILGIRDKEMQQTLTAENSSFAKTVEMCGSKEQSKEQITEIQAAAERSPVSSEINAIKAGSPPCSSCGLKQQSAVLGELVVHHN